MRGGGDDDSDEEHIEVVEELFLTEEQAPSPKLMEDSKMQFMLTPSIIIANPDNSNTKTPLDVKLKMQDEKSR